MIVDIPRKYCTECNLNFPATDMHCEICHMTGTLEEWDGHDCKRSSD